MALRDLPVASGLVFRVVEVTTADTVSWVGVSCARLVARRRSTSRGPGAPARLDLCVLPAGHPGPRGFSHHTLQTGAGPPPRGPTSAPQPSSGLASPSSSSSAEGSLPPPGWRTAVATTTATLALESTTFHS